MALENLSFIKNPKPESVGENVYEFLNSLQGPTAILLEGKDTTRTRALVTLLHGNEPSGVIAIHRWIKQAELPVVNIICIIASVKAANTEPQFSYRALPDRRDLNRCFKNPYNVDDEGILAEAILECIKEHKPEAVIDMHNTSGSGPSFAVATFMDEQHDALTSLFTSRLIITGLRLGALMEISEYVCPTVTIECGGRLDDEANEIAWDGLQPYFLQENILRIGDTDFGLELLHNPVRLELNQGMIIGEQGRSDVDLVLDQNIEHFNAGVSGRDSFLGWTKHTDANLLFVSQNSAQHCVVNELVYIENGEVRLKQDLKLFMITTDPVIARMDCLFYAVKSNGKEIIA